MYQERELDATLTISHFKEAPLPKNHTLAKWGLPYGSVVGFIDNFALFLFFGNGVDG